MRIAQEGRCPTHDDEELFYRHWPAVSGTPKGHIILFHRGHEHSGRMSHLVDELDLPDYSFFAWDARGHGRSSGQRGYSPSIGTSVRDVQTFFNHVSSTHEVRPEDTIVIAQSVGAVLVAAWAHDYAPNIRAMILASPAFKVKLYVPFARTLLKLASALRGEFFVNSYVKAKFLTHDPERIASYDTDPLITREIAVNILLGLYEMSDRIVADAAAITIPTQLLISGNDWVVSAGAQQEFYEKLGTSIKEQHLLPGFYHDTLGERDRGDVTKKARDFILARFSKPFARPSLLSADEAGFTRDEKDELSRPFFPLSPRGLYWSFYRLVLRIYGRLSDGVRLGHDTGFDSGSTLDYVYRNEPRGLGPIGRLIDNQYLSSIGWTGIRQRKIHAEKMIHRAMGKLSSSGMPIRIVDIAAGHGRYVLEAIEKTGVVPSSVLLRDFSNLNIESGSELIKQKGLSDIADFVRGDAFDRDDLASIEPRPTLGIVSGLYELFSNNEMVQRSLEGLAAAMEEGGYLIYTGQPWHPQLEMIARALSSHRQGKPWVMRRRTQAEMDQLVSAAGFTKLDQLIDEWGIFTVSIAQKEPK